MASEKDLHTQIHSGLNELSGLSDLDEGHRKVIESWLHSQLELERRGWKDKLQMAMKEIEKERKLATDVHLKIDELNSKFVPFAEVMGSIREPSMYMNTDHDLKVYRIDQLNRNIDALIKLLQHYSAQLSYYVSLREDKGQEDASETAEGNEELQVVIATLRNRLKENETEIQEIETRLGKEIQNLEEALEMQEGLLKTEKEKYSKQLEELQGIISHQRVKLRQYKEKKQSRQSIWSKGTQVDLSPECKESSVQVNVWSENGEVGVDSQGCKECFREDKENARSETNCSPSIGQGTRLHPAKSELLDINDAKMFLQKQNGLRKTKSMGTLSEKGAYHSVTIANEVLKSQREYIRIWLENAQNSKSEEQDSMMETFQQQVLEFDAKLDIAKKDMEMCQKRMAWFSGNENLDTSNVIQEQVLERELKRLPKFPIGTSRSLNNLPKESQNSLNNIRNASAKPVGYLGSVKLHNCPRHSSTADTELVLKLKGMNQRQMDTREIKSASRSTPKAKCLRCHKLYSMKEERHQCRFHPKTKRKIERYDARDKMVRLTYLWECCLQSQDAPGCCVGEHI